MVDPAKASSEQEGCPRNYNKILSSFYVFLQVYVLDTSLCAKCMTHLYSVLSEHMNTFPSLMGQLSLRPAGCLTSSFRLPLPVNYMNHYFYKITPNHLTYESLHFNLHTGLFSLFPFLNFLLVITFQQSIIITQNRLQYNHSVVTKSDTKSIIITLLYVALCIIHSRKIIQFPICYVSSSYLFSYSLMESPTLSSYCFGTEGDSACLTPHNHAHSANIYCNSTLVPSILRGTLQL